MEYKPVPLFDKDTRDRSHHTAYLSKARLLTFSIACTGHYRFSNETPFHVRVSEEDPISFLISFVKETNINTNYFGFSGQRAAADLSSYPYIDENLGKADCPFKPGIYVVTRLDPSTLKLVWQQPNP